MAIWLFAGLTATMCCAVWFKVCLFDDRGKIMPFWISAPVFVMMLWAAVMLWLMGP